MACKVVEDYANEKAAEAYKEAFKKGFEEGLKEAGLEKIANLYVRGYISYDIALEQVGSKEILDRLIASQKGNRARNKNCG